MLTRPTWETPPGGTDQWLPQRTRWLKGFVQTLGVHTRRPWQLGLVGLLALASTLGQAVVAAMVHGPVLLWIAAVLMISGVAGLPPLLPPWPMAILVAGSVTAAVLCQIGAKRAGIAWRLQDALTAPVYWSMLSIAMGNAVWQLVTAPHHWDKTRHRPEGGQAQAQAEPERLGTGRRAA